MLKHLNLYLTILFITYFSKMRSQGRLFDLNNFSIFIIYCLSFVYVFECIMLCEGRYFDLNSLYSSLSVCKTSKGKIGIITSCKICIFTMCRYEQNARMCTIACTILLSRLFMYSSCKHHMQVVYMLYNNQLTFLNYVVK